MTENNTPRHFQYWNALVELIHIEEIDSWTFAVEWIARHPECAPERHEHGHAWRNEEEAKHAAKIYVRLQRAEAFVGPWFDWMYWLEGETRAGLRIDGQWKRKEPLARYKLEDED